VILKQKSVLEKRFPNTKVTWVEFPAGPQLLEALSVGSLEFGLTGDSPPVFAQAAGKDLLYVGVEPPKPDSSAILVLGDSPLRSWPTSRASASRCKRDPARTTCWCARSRRPA
jgi:sulfonate transport system substrate-binding protein